MNFPKLFLPVIGLLAMTAAAPDVNGQAGGVFLHTDRDVYAPSQPVRFRAYAGSVPEDTGGLTLLLLNPEGKPAAERICPMDGRSASDSLYLPDTLRDGEYRLLAWTGVMQKGEPGEVWTKKIMIRKPVMPGLLIRVVPDAPRYSRGDQAGLAIHISTIEGKPAAGAQFLYLATKNGIPYQNGIGITDEAGNAMQPVRIPNTEEEGLIAVSVNAESSNLKGSALVELPGGGGLPAQTGAMAGAGQLPAAAAPGATVVFTEPGKGKGGDMSQVTFTVTGPDGAPTEADLSISVFDAVLSPGPARATPGLSATAGNPAAAARNEGLPFREQVIRHFQPDPMERMMAQYRLESFFTTFFMTPPTDLPAFIRVNKSFLQEQGIIPGKPTQDDRMRQQLEIGIPILSVIRSIKPYTLSNGQLFFSKGKNSLEYPKGALFIIDGGEKGYNADVLNNYSPYDIESIRISEKISEILKYSADACGLVLITTKKGKPAAEVAGGRVASGYDPTLSWIPSVKTDGSKPVQVSLPKPRLKTSRRMVIMGTDSQGNPISAVRDFPAGSR
jgi:hypothetical protein